MKDKCGTWNGNGNKCNKQEITVTESINKLEMKNILQILQEINNIMLGIEIIEVRWNKLHELVKCEKGKLDKVIRWELKVFVCKAWSLCIFKLDTYRPSIDGSQVGF